MINILLISGLFFILLFGLTIIFGAPFLPTLQKRTPDAIDLMGLSAGQTMLDLGSGDGRILAESAKRGIRGVGYELNPLLVWYSRLKLHKYRHLVRVKNANYMHAVWPKTDGIYMFTSSPYITKLHKKIIQNAIKPIKVVSFAYEIKGMKPLKSNNGMHLYKVTKNS